MNVLEKILELKQQRGWSEYRLSEESGIAQTTISSWFKRNITPSVGSLENVCKAFNITLSQFFAEEEERVVLTDNQKEMIDRFSCLSEQEQTALIQLLDALTDAKRKG